MTDIHILSVFSKNLEIKGCEDVWKDNLINKIKLISNGSTGLKGAERLIEKDFIPQPYGK